MRVLSSFAASSPNINISGSGAMLAILFIKIAHFFVLFESISRNVF
jgi:hypothetical protein